MGSGGVHSGSREWRLPRFERPNLFYAEHGMGVKRQVTSESTLQHYSRSLFGHIGVGQYSTFTEPPPHCGQFFYISNLQWTVNTICEKEVKFHIVAPRPQVLLQPHCVPKLLPVFGPIKLTD